MKKGLGILTLAALTATAGAAQAHPGSEVGGGFVHPVHGIDHILATLSTAPVGLLVAGGVMLAAAAVGAGILIRRNRQN